MIQAIVFDLWETIGTKNIGISKTLREHFGIENSPDFLVQYENAIQLKEWANEDDLATNFLISFSLPVTEESIRFVRELLQSGIANATPFDGMNDLLELLHKSYKLGLLSNTTNFESSIIKKWKMEKVFDATAFSCDVGSLKPAKEMFEAICFKLGISPDEAVFIDDGVKNVEAARALGFQAIRFENMEQLFGSLRDLGVIA